MIDPKMIEVIEEWIDNNGIVSLEVPYDILAQRLHNAGFRRVPSEDELEKFVVINSEGCIGFGGSVSFGLAKAIRKLMLGGE